MRTAIWLVLAACGGSGGDDTDAMPPATGRVTADATVDGAPVAFSAACKLAESEMYLDISATDAKLGFEIKWKKAIITAPGTYPTGGIIGDIFLFVLKSGEIVDASGSVTFTTYVAPTAMAGTFMLTATGVSATGSFDCH